VSRDPIEIPTGWKAASDGAALHFGFHLLLLIEWAAVATYWCLSARPGFFSARAERGLLFVACSGAYAIELTACVVAALILRLCGKERPGYLVLYGVAVSIPVVFFVTGEILVSD
jgi:hypothetical protein